MRIARVYEPAEENDHRILVDRLWPRGIAKSDERVGDWIPAVAPSTQLRNWYRHDGSLYSEFCDRYLEELDSAIDSTELVKLRSRSSDPHTVLVTATKAIELSHLPTLVRFLGQEPEPVIIPDRVIDSIERWVTFGGTWKARGFGGPEVIVDLFRCDGGELVETLSSADSTTIEWLRAHSTP